MADVVTGYGLIQGDRVDFTLNGLSTAAQMERLLKLTAELIKQKDPNNKRAASELKNLTTQSQNLNTAFNDLQGSTEKTTKRFDSIVDDLEGVFRPLMSGNFSLALRTVPGTAAKFAVGVGLAVGALTGYADKLKEGLQIGVAGNVFDLAIAAKSAGINMQDFTKALVESGGSFAQLGDGATSGAKQFGLLVDSVRTATAGVGNLGMNNQEMAIFTAKQLKIAIGQGFRGRQAQEAVITSSRGLSEELDMLAFRTGKNVMKLAESAMKLAQDPLVSNFVARAKQGGQQISDSVKEFAAGLSAMFGESGEQLAGDAVKSAMTGLPMLITESGRNLMMASQNVYAELERQAAIVRRGGQITEEDRQRLKAIVEQEVKVRGQQLEQFVMMGGPLGEASKRILEMAQQARSYNTDASKEKRAREKTAQEFNAEIRKLQASLQQLLIPFLKGLNAVDFTGFFEVLNFGVNMLKDFLNGLGIIFETFGDVFKIFGVNLEGTGDMLSKVMGIGLGLIAVLTTATAASKLLSYSKDKLAGGFMSLLGSLTKQGTQQQTVADRVSAANERIVTSAKGAAQALDRLASKIGTGQMTGRSGPTGQLPPGHTTSPGGIIIPEERKPTGPAGQQKPGPTSTPTSTPPKPSLLRRIGSPLAITGGILGGMALDKASEKAEEAGEETAASFLKGASTVLSFALTGAGIGMIGGPWVAALGGLLGAVTGTVSAFSSKEEKPIERKYGSPVLAGSVMEDFGKGTLAMLHGREGVITEKQLTNLAKGMQENTLTSAVDNLVDIIDDQPTGIFNRMFGGFNNIIQEKFSELKKQNTASVETINKDQLSSLKQITDQTAISNKQTTIELAGSLAGVLDKNIGKNSDVNEQFTTKLSGALGGLFDQSADKKLETKESISEKQIMPLVTGLIPGLGSTFGKVLGGLLDQPRDKNLAANEQFTTKLTGSIGGVLEQSVGNSLAMIKSEQESIAIAPSIVEPKQNVTAAEMIPKEVYTGKINNELTEQQILSVDQASKLAALQLEELKKFNANLSTLTDETGYGNAIAARNTTIQNDGNRYIREIAMRGSA